MSKEQSNELPADQQIIRCLEKVVKESSTSKRWANIKKAAQETLDFVQNFYQTEKDINENGASMDPIKLDIFANRISIPLKLACESRYIKIMVPALDCFQKCLSYHIFRGTTIDEENPPNRLISKVVSTISSCYNADDTIQLQVIKGCFTAVTEPICEVHEMDLLTAFRTIYYIYLLSRSQANQVAAKTTLTQLLHIVFQRIELKMSPDVVIGMDESFDDADFDQSLEFPKREGSKTFLLNPEQRSILKSSPTLERKQDSPQSLQSPYEFCRSIVLEIIGKIPKSNSLVMKSQGHYIFTDCYHLFRTLNKLSMKELPKDNISDSTIDMKSKILSLELLLTIIENSGPVLRSFDKFINNAIKKHLIASVLTNGVCPNPKVFRLTLQIFLALVSYFKDYLKNEIGFIYSKILLVILETPNSTVEQKWTVLQALLQICKNPQALVDIFVNYDCILEGENIFERMVTDLSKIAQGKYSDETSAQELRLRALGLECSVTIMKSLVDWSKDLRVEKTVEETEKEKQLFAQREDSSYDLKLNEVETSKNPISHKSNLPNFHEVKQYKALLQQGIAKFNLNHKKGLKFMIQEGLVENNPESISKFFRTTEGLDKKMLGDYLGEKDEFNQKVLHCYIDSFSFQNYTVDVALRTLLSNFRLPGEAQKIDRMMEKFAERYYTENGDIYKFANADAVYILSFAIVMLATDLHSPAIKDKMTKQQWKNMQRGVNDGKDFEEAFLEEIYDRIAAQKLTLQGEEQENVSNAELSDPKQRRIRFQMDMERTINSSKKVIKEKAKDKSIYYRAKQIEHVKPMFELVWPPMLAAFSVLMENSEDPTIIAFCLEGFKHAIRVSCTFYMEVERNTFVTSLAKFTFLNNLHIIKQKNIESIKTLLEIARTEANYLQDSWLQVLTCISNLEQLHLVGSGAKSQALPSEDFNPQKSRSHYRKPSEQLEHENAQIIALQIDAVTIDKIFSYSFHLNSNAIEDFVRCLITVSQNEINSPNPRMFSLQKLVEIAHFNMERIRIVWARVWRLLADHFTKVGCNENLRIALYAIDSLKQLAIKYLSRGELAHYNFQKEFLKPFEDIFSKNHSVKIRDIIVRCLSNMILSLANNLKSAWKGIISVFKMAALEQDDTIVHLAFDMVSEIGNTYFHLIADSFFVDYINCIIVFGMNRIYIHSALKAIGLLDLCAQKLGNGSVLPLEKQEDGFLFTDNEKHLAFWFPILTGLLQLIGHPHVEVRTLSLNTLFNILTSYGSMLSPPFWRLVFRGVLLPIFDNVRHNQIDLVKEDNEWLTSTCWSAFTLLLNLFSNFFDTVSFLLTDMLDLFSSCIIHENESLARIGAHYFLQLAMTNGSKFSEDMWAQICKKLEKIIDTNNYSPEELIKVIESGDELFFRSEEDSLTRSSKSQDTKSSNDEPVSLNSVEIIQIPNNGTNHFKKEKRINVKMLRAKCSVQLILVEVLSDITFTYYGNLATQHLVLLLDSLEKLYKFALIINENQFLRNKLGSSPLANLLLRQETTTLSCQLRMLFRMYSETSLTERSILAENRLIPRCLEIFKKFIEIGIPLSVTEVSQQEQKRITSYIQIIAQILKGIDDFDQSQFQTHLTLFYSTLCELVTNDNSDVRIPLRSIFVRIGKMYNIMQVENIKSSKNEKTSYNSESSSPSSNKSIPESNIPSTNQPSIESNTSNETK